MAALTSGLGIRGRRGGIMLCVRAVDLESGDRAVLKDAVIAGENGHLETAKQWLAAVWPK